LPITSRLQVIEKSSHGKAGAVKRGVEEANYRYILFTDFDQATPINEWEKLLPYLTDGFSLVMGLKRVNG